MKGGTQVEGLYHRSGRTLWACFPKWPHAVTLLPAKINTMAMSFCSPFQGLYLCDARDPSLLGSSDTAHQPEGRSVLQLQGPQLSSHTGSR